MCLRTNSTRKSTVKNPIRCLKVVAVSHTADGSAYHSFYTFNGSIEYKIGATVDMNEGRTEKNKDELRTLQDYRYRSGGPYASFPFPDFKRRVEAGLHTFSPEGNGARSVYEWGKKESEFYNNELSDRDDIAILECEIPTGAHYYKGITSYSTIFIV